MARSVLVALNCSDRKRSCDGLLSGLKKVFAGWEVTVAHHASFDELLARVRQARDAGYAFVAAAGGDGTVSAVGSLLAGSNTGLAIIPMGTVNALARSLGIPLDPVRALAYYDARRTTAIDIGMLNTMPFLCFVSIGIDAHAVHAVGPWAKRLFGRCAYAAAGLSALFRPSARAGFFLNDMPCRSMIVSNLPFYAGIRMFPAAHPGGEEFGWSSHADDTVYGNLRWCVRLMRATPGAAAYAGRSTEMRVRVEQPVFVQVDGEPVEWKSVAAGAGDIHIRFTRQALRVLC